MNADLLQYTDKVLLACRSSTECNLGTHQLLENRCPPLHSHTRDTHQRRARSLREIFENRAEATPPVSMTEGRHLPSHKCMAIQRQTQETCSFGMQETREIIEIQGTRGTQEIRETIVI